MPTTTTLLPVGWSVISGRPGFSTSESVRLRQLWRTATNSYTNALVGHEVTGEAIGLAWFESDTFGSEFNIHHYLRAKLTVKRQQWWCTYSLHIATFTSLAFAIDPLLLVSCWYATAELDIQTRKYAFWSQFVFMFAFTKVVKLMGLFLRNPSDVIFLPVSIVFGYFHGLVKLYALVTLNMVSFTDKCLQDSANMHLLRHPGEAEPTVIPTTRNVWRPPLSHRSSSRRHLERTRSSATILARRDGQYNALRKMEHGRRAATPHTTRVPLTCRYEYLHRWYYHHTTLLHEPIKKKIGL